MGVLRNIRAAREANRLKARWDQLRAGRGPTIAQLADVGGLLGMTSGDAAVIGVATLNEHIAVPAPPNETCDAIASFVERGQLRTVMGRPMNHFVDPRAAAYLASFVLGNVYPELREELDRYIADQQQDQKADAVRRLQEEYAYLNAELAPLVAEAERMAEIRRQLKELGAEPDSELNAQIKRDLGIPDTPLNE